MKLLLQVISFVARLTNISEDLACSHEVILTDWGQYTSQFFGYLIDRSLLNFFVTRAGTVPDDFHKCISFNLYRILEHFPAFLLRLLNLFLSFSLYSVKFITSCYLLVYYPFPHFSYRIKFLFPPQSLLAFISFM